MVIMMMMVLMVVMAMQVTAAPVSIVWMAPFWSGGGYCSEAIDFVLALDDLSPRVDISIVQHGDSYNAAFVDGLNSASRMRLEKLARKPLPSLPDCVICHSEPGAWHPARYSTSRCPIHAKLRIGRTMFETDRLPDGWHLRLNEMDRVWVPTEFSREIFVAGGVAPDRVDVIGEPVDVDLFDPARSSPHSTFVVPEGCSDATIFLSIFKWEERKGWKILIEAFVREFINKEGVCLLILTNAYHSEDNFQEQIDEFIGSLQSPLKRHLPLIILLSAGMATDLMPSLYQSASAFVLPSRGEGWGRPHVEAMASSIPVIATNWSGPTAFMTESNSYPIKIDGLEVIESGAFRGHQWARPSVEHLREHLRSVLNRPEDAARKGAQARVDMIARFAKPVLAEQVLSSIIGRLDNHNKAEL